MRRELAYLLIALVCSACVPDESSNDRQRVAAVHEGALRPNDICDQGKDCPDDQGGGGTDDPPPPDGTDGGKTSLPSDEPPIDELIDPKKGVDLLPIANLGTYCPRDKEGALVVNIRSSGSETSPDTTTRVTFAHVGDVTIATPPIAPGDTVQHHVPIPSECFEKGEGNCTIVIHADAFLDVTESSEANNEVTGVCPGAG
jgi:hypothetical protein